MVFHEAGDHPLAATVDPLDLGRNVELIGGRDRLDAAISDEDGSAGDGRAEVGTDDGRTFDHHGLLCSDGGNGRSERQ
jgi:hypothetical protein